MHAQKVLQGHISQLKLHRNFVCCINACNDIFQKHRKFRDLPWNIHRKFPCNIENSYKTSMHYVKLQQTLHAKN